MLSERVVPQSEVIRAIFGRIVHVADGSMASCLWHRDVPQRGREVGRRGAERGVDGGRGQQGQRIDVKEGRPDNGNE